MTQLNIKVDSMIVQSSKVSMLFLASLKQNVSGTNFEFANQALYNQINI